MKVIYFIAINIIVVVAICGVNMYTFINNIEHTNSIYFWIVSYAYVIGGSIIAMNCRNQILRLEELMEIKLKLDPMESEIAELLQMVDSEEVQNEMIDTNEEKTKNRFFKKRA